jgi:3-hydroxy-D-aspartate aldolase
MWLMQLSLERYALSDTDRVLTPALLIYPALVDANIETTLRMLGSDTNRWRQNIKTAKIEYLNRTKLDNGIRTVK